MYLNEGQAYAYMRMQEGNDIFLTGGAGTGKTVLLKHFIERSRDEGQIVLVCAPTGLATRNLNGVTCHKLFGLPLSPVISPPSKVTKAIGGADIIIIDEVSMLRCDYFEYIYKYIKMCEEKYDKKIQLIVAGDFYQLSPIYLEKDRLALERYFQSENLGGLYAFQSPLWNFEFIELTEVMRQKDAGFIEALNKVRVGNVEGYNWISEHCLKEPREQSMWIASTNAKVDAYNKKMLQELPSKEEKTYKLTFEGLIPPKNQRQFDDELTLRKGAQVMILVNDSNVPPDYINGTIGVVTDVNDHHVDVQIRPDFEVKFPYYVRDNIVYDIIEDNGKATLELHSVGKYSQIPLRLAWAITIHKSQGITLYGGNIHPDNWTDGLLYVALSRVQSVDRLYMPPNIEVKTVSCNKDVQEFYNNPNAYKYDWGREVSHDSGWARILQDIYEDNIDMALIESLIDNSEPIILSELASEDEMREIEKCFNN